METEEGETAEDTGPVPVESCETGCEDGYTQAAREQFGFMTEPIAAAEEIGCHVETPVDQIGGDMGTSGSGSGPPTDWSAATQGDPSLEPQPYNTCGPSYAMDSGGILYMQEGGSTSGSTEEARPVACGEVPLGDWETFLSEGWFGEIPEDWPELVPPSGWDPSTVYDPDAMRRGGILYMQEGGTTEEYGTGGGGLNASQIEAGIAAGDSVLGSPYAYGAADPAVGFDCAGIWNWIESAVISGEPSAGKSWGTYDAAEGSGGNFTTPGITEGGVNIGVDLSGWGGMDGTHMAGDIGGTAFESDMASNVHHGHDSGSFGTQYTMGGADVMAEMFPGTSGMGADPAGSMDQVVSDWWGCQDPAAYQDQGLGTWVEPYMSELPGVTEGYLQNVGQQTLGSAGTVSPTPTGDTLRDWVIAALTATGLDASEENISMLESLASKESSGDPSAMNSEGSGAAGLMQLMPDTWEKWNAGGDIMDPVANLIAAINYMMGRYGRLVDFSPYAEGGIAQTPHFGLVGEAGREAMLPLDNRNAMAQVRQGLGLDDFGDGLAPLVERVDHVAERIDHQTKVVPDRTGHAVGGGMDRRLYSNKNTRDSQVRASDIEARRNHYAGRY